MDAEHRDKRQRREAAAAADNSGDDNGNGDDYENSTSNAQLGEKDWAENADDSDDCGEDAYMSSDIVVTDASSPSRSRAASPSEATSSGQRDEGRKEYKRPSCGWAVTPWRDWEEWLAVFRDLFGDLTSLQYQEPLRLAFCEEDCMPILAIDTCADIEERRTRLKRALDTIEIWSLRSGGSGGTKFPLAIELTAAFVRVRMYDYPPRTPVEQTESPEADKEVSRLAYAMCVVRMVNGITEEQQRNNEYASSVAKLAQRAELPPWLVDVRHGATHQLLPPANVLRAATAAALRWLYIKYWLKQCKIIEPVHVGHTVQAMLMDYQYVVYDAWNLLFIMEGQKKERATLARKTKWNRKRKREKRQEKRIEEQLQGRNRLSPAELERLANFRKMKASNLKRELKSLGLSTLGAKPALLSRLETAIKEGHYDSSSDSDSSNIEASVSSSSLTSIAAISEESDKLGQIILSTVKQITLSIVTFSNAKRILIPLLLNVPIKVQDSKRTINQSSLRAMLDSISPIGFLFPAMDSANNEGIFPDDSAQLDPSKLGPLRFGNEILSSFQRCNKSHQRKGKGNGKRKENDVVDNDIDYENGPFAPSLVRLRSMWIPALLKWENIWPGFTASLVVSMCQYAHAILTENKSINIGTRVTDVQSSLKKDIVAARRRAWQLCMWMSYLTSREWCARVEDSFSDQQKKRRRKDRVKVESHPKGLSSAATYTPIGKHRQIPLLQNALGKLSYTKWGKAHETKIEKRELLDSTLPRFSHERMLKVLNDRQRKFLMESAPQRSLSRLFFCHKLREKHSEALTDPKLSLIRMMVNALIRSADTLHEMHCLELCSDNDTSGSFPLAGADAPLRCAILMIERLSKNSSSAAINSLKAVVVAKLSVWEQAETVGDDDMSTATQCNDGDTQGGATNISANNSEDLGMSLEELEEMLENNADNSAFGSAAALPNVLEMTGNDVKAAGKEPAINIEETEMGNGKEKEKSAEKEKEDVFDIPLPGDRPMRNQDNIATVEEGWKRCTSWKPCPIGTIFEDNA